MPAPASCGDCGRYVAVRAKKIIANGFGDAEGKDAFDAALRAARSADTDDENVALASEVELDDEASADSGSAKEDDRAEGDADDDAPPGGSGAGEADEVSTSEDTEDEIEDKVSADTSLKPVAGKNAAATTSEPREASVTGGKVMAWARALFFSRLVSTWPGGPFGTSFPE